jgi:hypothetical protein
LAVWIPNIATGVEVARGLDEIGAIHVRDETGDELPIGVVAERRSGHGRPEVRAADADVDDVPDPLAGVPAPPARPDALGEG